MRASALTDGRRSSELSSAASGSLTNREGEDSCSLRCSPTEAKSSIIYLIGKNDESSIEGKTETEPGRELLHVARIFR